MIKRSIINTGFIYPLLLLVFLTFLFFLSQSPIFRQGDELLTTALTIDFVVILPLIYFFLIRKSRVPNITIVPVFILCILIAGVSIPTDQQFLLTQFKTWLVPLVELAVVSYIIIKIRQVRREFKNVKNISPDFYFSLETATRQILPSKVAILLTMEIAVIYYGFINWKKRNLAANEFSNYKSGSTLAVLYIIILLVAIEATALHFLLQSWSATAAWILTIISVYSGIQVFGIARSIPKRPISISNGNLILRLGILSEITIPLHEISEVEVSSRELSEKENIVSLSPLGTMDSHNFIVKTEKTLKIKGLYGMTRTGNGIAFHVDDIDGFQSQITI